MAVPAKHVLKDSFSIKKKVETFFTGNKIEISPDGQYLFCPNGNKLNVINKFDGTLAKQIKLDESDLLIQFALSPDGEKLVIAYQSGLLRLWNWKEFILERTWKSFHVGPIAVAVFDSTSTLLATGGSDSTIKIWDVVKNYCTHNLRGCQGVFSAVTFHPKPGENCFHIYGAATDNNIYVWDLMSSSQVDKLVGHCGSVTSIVFSSCLKWILSASRDKIVIVWDSKSYEKIRSIPVFEAVESLVIISPIEKLLFLDKQKREKTLALTAGEKGILKIWNFVTGSLVFERSLFCEVDVPKANDIIFQVINNVKLEEILIVTSENNIISCSLNDFSVCQQRIGNADEILDVALLGDSEDFLAVATNSPNIKIFNIENLNCQILIGHTDTVLCLSTFQKDKSYFLSSSKDKTVCLWKFNSSDMSGVCYYKGYGHSHSITAVAAPHFVQKFFVSVSEDMTLKLWKLPKVFDAEDLNSKLTVKETRHAHDKLINSVAISPNDQFIVTGSQDKTAKLWSAEGLNFLGVFKGHRRGVWSANFSPVDQVVVTSSADGTIKIWGVKDFKCLKTFQGHDCSVLKVFFIDNGLQLISCSSDGNVKIWNLKKNECVKTIDAHEDKIWALEKSSDENLLITAGSDSVLIIWEDVTVKEKEKIALKNDLIIKTKQAVDNLIQQKKWCEALSLALKLNHPFRVLNIIKEILTDEGDDKLEETLIGLREDQLLTLLGYSQTWNTNSKHCLVAQLVLKAAFKTFVYEDLFKIPGIKQKVESLLPYTERHVSRLSRLQQNVTFVDFVSDNIKLSESSDGKH